MKKQRQKSALERLKAQLKSGTKPELVTKSVEGNIYKDIPLTEQDVKRINKEIEVLTSKI